MAISATCRPRTARSTPTHDFRMLWEVDPKSNQRINDIARALKGADKLILATDPDREGEAISWHVLEVLKEKKALKDQTVERVVFNAITKQSVTEAMKHPRAIDAALVDAYLARRALDYLVGFTLSPVLWRKLPGARSAGRVQSVALRLVCDRELEIEKFVAKEYWSIVAKLATPRNEAFEARLVGADGKKIQRLDIGSGAEAEAFTRDLETASFTVAAVEAKPARRNPPPPFTTSTMQQEASRKLGFAPAIAMRLAQRLYEGVEIDGETTGLITYMRTDGIDMAPEAIADIRAMLGKNYGKEYVPASPRELPQQVEERAGSARSRAPDQRRAARPAEVAKYVDRDQARLYELIWNRAVASQMESAELERTTVDIAAKAGARTIELRATGQVVKFDGFLTLYQEGQDETARGRRVAPPAGDVAKARRSPSRRSTPRSISPSRRRASRKPRWSSAWKSSASAGPRPTPRSCKCCRTAAMCASTRSGSSPKTKAASSSASWKASSSATSNTISPPTSKNSSTEISNNEIDWQAGAAAISGPTSSAAVNDIKELRITAACSTRSTICSSRTSSRRAPTAATAAPVPAMRHRPALAQARTLRRLHRLLELSGMQFHPADDAGRRRRAARTKVLGEDPATGLEVTLRGGRFGHLSAARRAGQAAEAEEGREETGSREAQARQPAERRCARRHRSRKGAGAAGAAARSRHVIRKTASRSSPASAASAPTSSTARPTPISKTAKTSYRRPQPRGHPDRREEGQSRQRAAASAPIRARRSASIPTKAGRSWSRTAATGPMSATTASTPPSPATRRRTPSRLTEAVVLLDARAEQLGSQPRRAAGRKGKRRQGRGRGRQGRIRSRAPAEGEGAGQARRSRAQAKRARSPPPNSVAGVSCSVQSLHCRYNRAVLGAGSFI